MNNDYKNGYNRAVEVLLITIDMALNSKKTGYESINDVVLGIKRDLINSAYYMKDESDKSVPANNNLGLNLHPGFPHDHEFVDEYIKELHQTISVCKQCRFRR
jgi:hypothetical protein